MMSFHSVCEGVRGVDYHSIIVFFPTGWSMFKAGAYFAHANVRKRAFELCCYRFWIKKTQNE